MTNPMYDPAMESGKDQTIAKLKEELNTVKNMNLALTEGYTAQLNKKDIEMEEL